MKRCSLTRWLSLCGVVLWLLGAASSNRLAAAEVREGQGPGIDEAQKVAYDGPKARIAIANFEDKTSGTGQYRAEFGRGLADMLSAALFNTNRFIVLERQQLSYVLAEQDFGATGRVRPETAARIGEIEGADLLVVAAVTGFDPGVSGGGGGLDLLGGLLPGPAAAVASVLGSIAGGFKTAYVAIDVRLVDAKTGRVVAATSADAKATSFSGALGTSATSFGGALGIFSKTPMEKAIREVVQAAVDFVATKTPTQYYRGPAVQVASAPGSGLPAGPRSPASQTEAGLMTQGPSQPQVAAPQPSPLPPAQVAMAVATVPTAPAPLPPSPNSSPKAIMTEKNPKLMAELTEAKRRGAVVSITVTVRNNTPTTQPLEFGEKETYLLNYDDGAKLPLISIQGKGKSDLGPNEQSVIRVHFKAPPQAQTVGVVIEDIGTFDDVSIQ